MLFAFALNNQEDVQVRFFWGLQWRSPLVLVLLGFFAAGVVVGVLGMVVTMTRSDLVEELASRFPQLGHSDAEFAVKALLDAMSEAMVKGHRIELRGFGSFSVNRRPPRMGRNPRSGEAVAIPEKKVPHFKPGKALREAVDMKTQELLKGNTP